MATKASPRINQSHCYKLPVFPFSLLSLGLDLVCLLHGLIIVCKLQTDTIDTVSLVSGCVVTLSLKDMSQVSSTVAANDLCAFHTKGAVGVAIDGPWNGIKESGPAAARFELVRGLVKGSFAAGTGVDTFRRVMRVVFTSERWLCAFLAEDTELLCRCQLSVFYLMIHNWRYGNV